MAVDLSLYKSWLSEEIRDEGRARGLTQGMAQSRAEDIPLLLDCRGIDISDARRERITSCDDLDALGR